MSSLSPRGGKGNLPARRRPVTPNVVAADLALLKFLIAIAIAVVVLSH